MRFESEATADSEEDSKLNLRLEMPETLVKDYFDGPNEKVHQEIKYLIEKDDSDMLYFNRKMDMLDSKLVWISEDGTEIKRPKKVAKKRPAK